MTDPDLFSSAAEERDRIAQDVAARFACYGPGSPPNPHNAMAVTLKEQPAQFGFGVKVRDVVDAICDMAGVLPLPDQEK
jgi:hypothetical protein